MRWVWTTAALLLGLFQQTGGSGVPGANSGGSVNGQSITPSTVKATATASDCNAAQIQAVDQGFARLSGYPAALMAALSPDGVTKYCFGRFDTNGVTWGGPSGGRFIMTAGEATAGTADSGIVRVNAGITGITADGTNPNGMLQAAQVSSPILRTGNSSNRDAAGTLTLASGTASYTFTGTYAVAPICTASDTTAIANTRVTTTTTTLTIVGTGTDAVNYICVGRT